MDIIKHLTQPGWGLKLGKKSLIIEVPDEVAASQLLDSAADQLAIAAAKFSFKDAHIRWGKGERPFRVLASIKQDDDKGIPDLVFGEGLGFDTESLKLLERMQQSEKPMSICDLESDAQEWGNRGLALMLKMPIQQVTTLNMRDYWAEEGLQYVKEMLRQQSLFEYNGYEARLPYGSARFSSTFEVVEFGLHVDQPKRKKRLVTIHSYEPIAEHAWV